MVVVLRFGTTETRAEIGQPGPDGLVFAKVVDGGTFIPFRQTAETIDGLPVFAYAMTDPER